MLITEYQESWKIEFEEIEKVLQIGLNNLNVKIEHIGSTAVNGLAAKPIIDIDLIYFQSSDFDQIKNHLEELNYYHNGDQGIAGREVFKRRKGQNHPVLDSINHHLYVCHTDCEELKRHLLFRDRLRIYPELRNEYEALKLKLAEQANQNKKTYAELKEKEAKTFFENVLNRTNQ